MALTYTDSANLMNDMVFRGRVKTACLKFATSVLDEAGTVAAHGARARWANQCMLQPDMAAATVTPPTVLDPAVQTAGGTIDDPSLQAAVEGVINSLM
jgi:hypothetical protein